MRILRPVTWILIPLAIAAGGAIWMLAAVRHYERVTGRAFYGLAAQHYSVPDWGMTYHPGGQAIENWTVDVPAWSTLGALFIALLFVAVIERKRRSPLVQFLYFVWHFVVAVLFILVVAWVSFNVTGVFI